MYIVFCALSENASYASIKRVSTSFSRRSIFQLPESLDANASREFIRFDIRAHSSRIILCFCDAAASIFYWLNCFADQKPACKIHSWLCTEITTTITSSVQPVFISIEARDENVKSMTFYERAFRYIWRKRSQSILLLVCFFIISVIVLSATVILQSAQATNLSIRYHSANSRDFVCQ